MNERDFELEKRLNGANDASPYRFAAYQVLNSTNAFLKALSNENSAREWDVVIAREQTAGRGRLGRSFFSPGTGLYMSVLLKPADTECGSDAPKLITVAAAVAAARAVDKLLIKHSKCGEVKIKWVNDIYLYDRKVCGILAEGVLSQTLKSVVLGIGVNIFPPENGFPEDIADKASCLLPCSSDKNDVRAELALSFLNEFRSLYARLDEREYMREYRERAYLTDKTVEFEREGSVYSGRVMGIDDDAALLVKLDSGGTVSLAAGEVSVKPRRC